MMPPAPARLDPQGCRALFPVTRERAYLAACSVGPLSTRAVAAMHAQIADQHLDGPRHVDRRNAFAEGNVRPTLARLIGARASEISFLRNTTEGLNTVANGLDWRPGDNVVISNIEYPANALCWLNLRRRGVETRIADARARGGRLAVDDIAALIDSRTRLVSVSLVQYSNGFRQDMAATAALCREKGVLLNCDAVQAVGALEIDVARLPVDFLQAGGHKWLAGPVGTGFLYCREESADRLASHAPGPGSVGSAWTGTGSLPQFHRDGRRFEEALPNYAGLWGLNAAAETLLEIGLPRIEAHVLGLSERMADGALRKGYRLASPAGKGERSGIAAFRHPSLPSAAIAARLEEAGIDVTDCNGALRAGAHVYNTAEDVDRMLDALP
ncbi:aminotransferase class V-fold PLP-dependent enzyme [Mangrovicoccus sp. HB161399]|uniref:aminotransferase class V-fold PLP-dependent enzyme n=1 Tax=Mangrovicoccus sp. HB161399 TaxID=2720392 RepID=UPI001C12E135|nr:aminotransferase class V-fold PLP-dependent enzyme [Mangrovicoccus sp. HB161399]